jgi:hypothetical protein
MARATNQVGDLLFIDDCYIQLPVNIPNRPTMQMQNGSVQAGNSPYIFFNILPKISDSHASNFNDESIMGRSMPLKTYASGGVRAINIEISYLIVDEQVDPQRIWAELKAIQACTYPQDGGANIGAPFLPPFICRLKCGHMIGKNGIFAVLRNYSVNFPTDVAWYWDNNDQANETIRLPFYFTISTSWEAVYRTIDLPGAQRILDDGSGVD